MKKLMTTKLTLNPIILRVLRAPQLESARGQLEGDAKDSRPTMESCDCTSRSCP